MDGTGFAGKIAAIGKRCAAALARRTKMQEDGTEGAEKFARSAKMQENGTEGEEDVKKALSQAEAERASGKKTVKTGDVERVSGKKTVKTGDTERTGSKNALNGAEAERASGEKTVKTGDVERKELKKKMTGNEKDEKDVKTAFAWSGEDDGRLDSDEDAESFFGDGEDVEYDAPEEADGGEDGKGETDDTAQGERGKESAPAAGSEEENGRRLAEIKRAFPECGANSVEELGDAFAKLMAAGARIGLSAADAYAATHISQIKAEAERAAETRARARAGSKAHLVRSEGSQSTLCEVPKGVYEKYKRLMPNVSDREIREHYNRSLRGETEQ